MIDSDRERIDRLLVVDVCVFFFGFSSDIEITVSSLLVYKL